jgi:hypothetical protein
MYAVPAGSGLVPAAESAGRRLVVVSVYEWRADELALSMRPGEPGRTVVRRLDETETQNLIRSGCRVLTSRSGRCLAVA